MTKTTNGAPVEAAPKTQAPIGTTIAVGPYAKELFEQEKGLRMALQFLSSMVGRANARAWEEMYRQAPELKGAFAVYQEDKNIVEVVDPNPQPQAPVIPVESDQTEEGALNG